MQTQSDNQFTRHLFLALEFVSHDR